MRIHVVVFARSDDSGVTDLGKFDFIDPSEAQLGAAIGRACAAAQPGETPWMAMLCAPGHSHAMPIDETGAPVGMTLGTMLKGVVEGSRRVSKSKLMDLAGPLLDDPDATEADRNTIRRLLRPGELTDETIRVVRNLVPEGYDELSERHGWPQPMADAGDRLDST